MKSSLFNLTGLVSLTGLLILIFHASPVRADEVLRLEGEKITGEILKIDQQVLVRQTDNQETQVPLQEVLELVWKNSATTPEQQSTSTINLINGSLFRGELVTCDGLQAQWKSAAFGQVSVPLTQVKSVLFVRLDDKTESQWADLLQKENSDDMLVIRKGDVLDFLPGVVTEYNESEFHFLYQGSEIPVKRERVFGIIHPRKSTPQKNALCSLTTTTGDKVLLQNVSLQDKKLRAEPGPNQTLEASVEQIQNLDFSLGKIVYLSNLTPDGVEYTPYFDTVWNFQKDRTNINGPLSLAGIHYPKGLWIHSKTRLNYRLAGEYSRLRCMVGIDDSVATNGLGHVRLQILADDKLVIDQDVSAETEPFPLDLDLQNVRFLQIVVDFGKGLDIGDHLVLGDAKLMK